ncbi:MAG: hypothetical protein WAN74_02035 [Thermoplasmata archaeon]
MERLNVLETTLEQREDGMGDEERARLVARYADLAEQAIASGDYGTARTNLDWAKMFSQV